MAIEFESSEERMKTNQKYKLKKTHSLWILNTWFYINFEGAARIPSHHSFTSHALYTYTHLHTINRMKEEKKHFCTTGRKFIISYPSIKPYQPMYILRLSPCAFLACQYDSFIYTY